MKTLLPIFFIFFFSQGFAQDITGDKVLPIKMLKEVLKDSVKNELEKNGEITDKRLAAYFRKKFTERFFYNWENLNSRFDTYKKTYPGKAEEHKERAYDHINKYDASTNWVLPFNYKNGEAVDAYALRHLARQHKMVDIAFEYLYSGKDPKYIKYFTTQMQSLNNALKKGDYEKIEDGNGVYEVYRSGYRILNWLWVHNMFLSSDHYSDEEQLQTIATLLQHAEHLYQDNPKFRPGNHQTRGMSALAMVSILFQDFEPADQWRISSLDILSGHLENEINDDGFQFERSVHYHISDIENFYFVYRLAQISDIKLSKFWDKKINDLFSSLTKIAFPDKSAPVLQDDTDTPWAESNDIGQVMTLGYLLFRDSEFGFFASGKMDSKMYWFIDEDQFNSLNKIDKRQPELGSLQFEKTGYYVIREGWNPKDKMMIISSGLDDQKPDHQHGDMLGIQAMANERIILPNYQVRYYLEDLELFKNSLVKNVALVDDILQGKEYTSNRGGSGFGKFKKLPKPKTIAWEKNNQFDLFIGSHNGFEDNGVIYSRQVIYLKDDFWIVKDNFNAQTSHSFKQIWQGHYTDEQGPNLLRSSFDNGSGLDIFQLNDVDRIEDSGRRGKQWSIAIKDKVNDYSFITILYPFSKYSERIDENQELPELKDWTLNNSKIQLEDPGARSISKNEKAYIFSFSTIEWGDLFIESAKPSDIYIEKSANEVIIYSLDSNNIELKIKGGVKCNSENHLIELAPGKSWTCTL